MNRCYADYAATAPMLDSVREAIAPWLFDYGNPSSLHEEGRRARHAIDQARDAVAEAMDCAFGEIVFTSSGTEAVNLAILGSAIANQDPRRRRVVIGAADHHAALRTLPCLEMLGYLVDLTPVLPTTQTDLAAFEALMSDDVLLVSLLHANNETGVIQPVPELVTIARRLGALVHLDAVQTFGRWAWTPSQFDADLVSVSSHKIGGPKGIGALFVRAGTKIKPIMVGGGQERELRSGTENVAGIVGFGRAVAARSDRSDPRRSARDAFLATLEAAKDPRLRLTADPRTLPVLDGHLHVRFEGLSAESLLILLDRLGVAASSGAACSAGSVEPSHVLLAAGFSPSAAREGLRFSFGPDHDEAFGVEVARRVLQAVERVGAAKPARAAGS
ncbi:MAG: cysteine desulfurase [Fimbriimonadaceae bacterium]|nr:cysteine desulfurase [Fimbriimonadaceae bacterium]